MKEYEGLTEHIKTLDDAVNTALAIEKQGHEFYLEKASTSTGIEAKDLFVYLAAEEAKHIEYLDGFLKEGRLSDIIETHPPDFTRSFASEFVQEKPGEVGVLISALRFEQKNEHFYNRLAAWADNPNQKEFFDMMASFEHKHVELIDGFIEDATQFRMQT